ncbi:hypothetical protein ABH931_000508 [Streptacidiphilus sp. MAP12-33]|uniref:SMI1/KNR4 family protein n=1 Tax=Streptacidiphilus sp. MAP12-33 TaxID=3156266 RepID=UPI003516FF52
MNGIESVDALVELLARHPDEANWTGGLSTEDLSLAESELGVGFPPSYRHFLSSLGSCEAGSEEFLGVYRTPAMGGRLLGTVAETLEAQVDLALPGALLVIQFDGMGGLVCLDVSRLDEQGEAPVAVWDPGSAGRGGPEQLDPDFGTYVLRQCRRALLRG